MKPQSVHINCDMAESFGNFRTGDDLTILPFVDAVNIACGFHGGDPLTIRNVIAQALKLEKQIGAHPSYPDLVGFGRRFMEMSNEELSASIFYQICAIKSMTESLGGILHHIKPHGALYNTAVKDKNIAAIIVKTINEIDHKLNLVAPEYSEMSIAAKEVGITVIHEAFADRRYNHDGTLASRSSSRAVIDSPEQVFSQFQLLMESKAETIDGIIINVNSDTICLHGDHPKALKSLVLIRKHFI